MFETKPLRFAIVFIAAVAVLGLSGCILSPKEDKPDPQPSVWKDLTQKEDVIDNLLQAYKSHDINHYKELLLIKDVSAFPEYLWYNQETDVQPGTEPYSTRDEDIAETTAMFAAADHTAGAVPSNLFLEKLTLTLTTGSWQQIAEFSGIPCSDCWETTREYGIEIIFSDTGNGFTGDDLVKFTIVGVPENGKTYYRLARLDDIKKP